MQNPTYEERKAALIDEINTVFNGVSRENGVSFSEATVIDDYGSMEERLVARKSDTETRWQDVPERNLSYEVALCFMDAIGFRYYIPAYMVFYLRHVSSSPRDPRSYRYSRFNSLVFFLNPFKYNDLREHKLSQLKLFTPEESKIIAHFLQFAQEQDEEDMRKYEEWASEEEEKERQEMRLEGMSEEEIENDLMECRLLDEEKESAAKAALQAYWGQFL